jgi:hypothetical protein
MEEDAFPIFNILEQRWTEEERAGATTSQIAEDSGGRNQLLHLTNACSITLGLWPDSVEYREWNVTYIRDDSSLPAFQINIDPFTAASQ